MLSGISRKRSIRSNPCWFTEFCKSQCLSHFAAPFIVVRAETSVAESCKEAITEQRFPPTGSKSTTQSEEKLGGQAGTISTRLANGKLARSPSRGRKQSPGTAREPHRAESSHLKVHRLSVVKTQCVNDPSAGSPTETLLRLLLPLSDKVH